MQKIMSYEPVIHNNSETLWQRNNDHNLHTAAARKDSAHHLHKHQDLSVWRRRLAAQRYLWPTLYTVLVMSFQDDL